MFDAIGADPLAGVGLIRHRNTANAVVANWLTGEPHFQADNSYFGGFSSSTPTLIARRPQYRPRYFSPRRSARIASTPFLGVNRRTNIGFFIHRNSLR